MKMAELLPLKVYSYTLFCTMEKKQKVVLFVAKKMLFYIMFIFHKRMRGNRVVLGGGGIGG